MFFRVYLKLFSTHSIKHFNKFKVKCHHGQCQISQILNNRRLFSQERSRNLLFTSYSHFLNPLCGALSRWKCYGKNRRPENESDPFLCMTQRLATVTREDCDGYYRDIRSYVRRSINNEIIED
ncbi:hypothetical protein RF11_02340 [Thelohanellus kitauei]|uniref:Uncharacterized protein n=1 Tax=Thelohanellus kitauei TaxID=669202 RepID=A0A0C2JVA1_THEKT|nr:hypothetical protein RF11_02340 [Thelohanellus kitauei]